MKCHDFERLWNERLDARGTPIGDERIELETHAASCPACRALEARYRVLNQALSALAPIGTPSGFTDRCLQAFVQPRERPTAARRVLRYWPAAAVLAAAASLLVVIVFGQRPGMTPAVAEHAYLTDALADATSATWDLAREASAPAARIGRDVLGTTVVASDMPGSELDPFSSVNTATDVLQSVGERMSEGVRPLSGTARHAFGFLLGPTLAEPKDAPRPS